MTHRCTHRQGRHTRTRWTHPRGTTSTGVSWTCPARAYVLCPPHRTRHGTSALPTVVVTAPSESVPRDARLHRHRIPSCWAQVRRIRVDACARPGPSADVWRTVLWRDYDHTPCVSITYHMYGEVGATLTFNSTTRMKGTVKRRVCQYETSTQHRAATLSPRDRRGMPHIVPMRVDLRPQ